MENPKTVETIDQKTTNWTNRLAVTAFISIVLATNTFTAYITQQEKNTELIAVHKEMGLVRDEYNKRRSDKKDDRILAEAKNFVYIEGLLRDREILEKELEYCNKRNEK